MANNLFTQSMPKMPEFPEITAPTLGSGFYKPEIPYFPFTKNSSETKNSVASPKEPVISDGATATDLLTNYLNSSNILSASDITSLSESGSFSTLSSLYGNSDFLSSTQTNTTLQKILTTLEDLKNENKKNTNNATPQKTENGIIYKEHKPSILRFKINGYDLRDSLSTTYFSQMENDGSFLLTADRRYVTGNKVRNETFYLLFKAKEGLGSSIVYDVAPSLSQDSKNENSFLYKLSELKNVSAQKTGNLVVLRTDSKDCSVDLLLDLDN